MRQSITVLAPAKINLGLSVFPRREDGYHDIQSIFTTVNLCDRIFVERWPEKDVCLVDCKGMDLPKENTFTKAYKAFCVLTGIRDGVHVTVEKHIPAGGGLGGGSSDSSSFIQSIDILFGTQLDSSAWGYISSQVGSDVFFFSAALQREKKLLNGRVFSAVVEGRGERIYPIESRTDLWVLLVFPGVFVSTAEAYALVDANMKSCFRMSIQRDRLVNSYNGPVREWFFSNDFATPVVGRYPKIQQALNSLKGCGADFVDMSGSGSTVFGIFEKEDNAVSAYEAIARQWCSVLVH